MSKHELRRHDIAVVAFSLCSQLLETASETQTKNLSDFLGF